MNEEHWRGFASWLADRAFLEISAQPEFLLERDAATIPPADIYVVRLFGFDEQTDDELFFHERPPIDWRRPLSQRMTVATPEPSALDLRTATYRLQSGFATHRLSMMSVPVLPPGVVPDNAGMFTVAFLRYKRAD